MTLSITALYHCAECHYAGCHVYFIFMLNASMQNVVMLSVVMLNVVAPVKQIIEANFQFHFIFSLWLEEERGRERGREGH